MKVYRKSRKEACASLDSIWKTVRQTKNRAFKQPYLPNIQKSDGYSATEPQEKIEELKKVLMPTSHAADFSDLTNFVYLTTYQCLELPKKKSFKPAILYAQTKLLGPTKYQTR